MLLCKDKFTFQINLSRYKWKLVNFNVYIKCNDNQKRSNGQNWAWRKLFVTNTTDTFLHRFKVKLWRDMSYCSVCRKKWEVIIKYLSFVASHFQQRRYPRQRKISKSTIIKTFSRKLKILYIQNKILHLSSFIWCQISLYGILGRSVNWTVLLVIF